MTGTTLVRLGALVVLCSAGAPLVARAQVLRGTVTGPTSTVAGAAVVLTDLAGTTHARALSSTGGQFALRAPAPGRYRLEVRRLGYRPRTVGPFAIARDTAVDIALERLPVSLPPVAAVERARCRANPGAALASGILWDEARSALLAADITMRDSTYRFAMVLHSRMHDMLPPPQLVESLFESSDHDGFEPWKSIPVDSLERRGYVTVDSSGVRYVAPDLAVLLSPYFTRMHCFRIVDPARTSAGTVGLEFTPTDPGRRTEIRGMLWFDRESRMLRELSFSYVNLPYRSGASVAGGSVEFRRLDDGAVILPRWNIRTPIPERSLLDASPRQAGSAVNVYGARPPERRGAFSETSNWVRATGGTLLSVERRGSSAPLWSRGTSTLTVNVYEQRTETSPRMPVAGVNVGFAKNRTQGVTDSSGAVRFDGLVEGDYVLETEHALAKALHLPIIRSVAEVGNDSAATLGVRVPTPHQALMAACAHDTTKAALVGVLLTEDGTPLAGAKVGVRSGTHIDTDSSTADFQSDAVLTEPDGRFGICSAPRGVVLILLVEHRGEHLMTHRTRVPGAGAVHVVDLVIPKRD